MNKNLSYKVITREVDRMIKEMSLNNSDLCELAEHFIGKLATSVPDGVNSKLGKCLLNLAMDLYYVRSALNNNWSMNSAIKRMEKNMNIKVASVIVESGIETGCELQLREKYSGRGMYGKETCAIVFDNFGDLLSSVAHAAEFIRENEQFVNSYEGISSYEFQNELSRVRMDNMGNGWVVY